MTKKITNQYIKTKKIGDHPIVPQISSYTFLVPYKKGIYICLAKNIYDENFLADLQNKSNKEIIDKYYFVNNKDFKMEDYVSVNKIAFSGGDAYQGRFFSHYTSFDELREETHISSEDLPDLTNFQISFDSNGRIGDFVSDTNQIPNSGEAVYEGTGLIQFLSPVIRGDDASQNNFRFLFSDLTFGIPSIKDSEHGVKLKTINGESIIGDGDIKIQGSAGSSTVSTVDGSNLQIRKGNAEEFASVQTESNVLYFY